MMNNYFRSTWIAAVALVALAFMGGVNSAHAVPTFFTNESAFNTAIGGASLNLESFESPFVDGTPSVAFADLVVTGDQNLMRVNPVAQATDGTGTIGMVDFNFNGNFVTFTFNSPINAFSLDVLNANDFGSGGNLILSNNNGASQALYGGLLPTNFNSYSALIDNATSFTSVAVNTTLTGDGLQFDRLGFGLVDFSPASVPEPETFLLMLAGLGLIGVFQFVASRKNSTVVEPIA
jgi:hypothetical protein